MKYALSTAAAIAAFAMLSPAMAGDITGAHKMSRCGSYQLNASSGEQTERVASAETDALAGNGDGGNTSEGPYQLAGNGDGGVTSSDEILKAENTQVAE